MSLTTPAVDSLDATAFTQRAELAHVSAEESQRVQMARGIACFLLVAFHVIGAQATSGLHVADDSGYRLFTNLLAYVRMPLFTFLSGFVYAYRPVKPGDEDHFAVKKLRRLGIPFLVATTLMYLGHLVAGDRVMPELAEAWRVYVVPIDHLWFVSSLLGIFGLVIALEAFGALHTLQRWAVVFAVAVAGYLLIPRAPMDVLGLNELPYLLPYFLAGLAANRFRAMFFSANCLHVLLALFIVMQAAYSAFVLTHMQGSLDVTVSHTVTGLVIGVAAGICALRWLPRVSVVQSIGTHSYAIYLYHPVFVAVARLGLKHMEPPLAAQFWVGMLVGILGPMMLVLAVARIPWAQLLLVGTSGKLPKPTRAAALPTSQPSRSL
ncbi:MAG: acyltransferase [Steroidobacteraceae bacterium]